MITAHDYKILTTHPQQDLRILGLQEPDFVVYVFEDLRRGAQDASALAHVDPPQLAHALAVGARLLRLQDPDFVVYDFEDLRRGAQDASALAYVDAP
jgi:hypothetical protein